MNVERFPVEETAIALFARAVGDSNPIYRDRAYAARTELGTIIAPPTFVEMGTQFDESFPLRPRPRQPWLGSGREATGTPAGAAADGPVGMHAEQHFTYHRPLRPGNVLSAAETPGKSWEKVGRSGPLRFSEAITEFRDAADEPVITGRSVAVYAPRPGSQQPGAQPPGTQQPGKALSGPQQAGLHQPHSREGGRAATHPGFSVGDTRELVVVDNLTRSQLVMYAGASGDYNPLHTDEVYATKVAGFPTVFGHGMLTMAMTARVLTDWAGDGRLRTYGVRFARQVWPGDTLTARATLTAMDHADGEPVATFQVTTVNQDGVEVIRGTATAVLS